MNIISKLDRPAFIFFLFATAVGLGSHWLVVSDLPPLTDRQLFNLFLGMGYDVQGGALLTIIAVLVSWRMTWVRRRRVLLSIFFSYCLFLFIDYNYLKNFGTHLPFSTLEYIKDAQIFSSTAGAIFSSTPVLLLLLLPFVSFWGLVHLSTPTHAKTGTPPGRILTLLFVMVIGGGAGSYSNSYVTKNMNDPLTSGALVYFYWSRDLETVEEVTEPVQALKNVASTIPGMQPPDTEIAKYPLIRDLPANGCRPPMTELARQLCKVERPNILVLLVESFRTWEMGVYGAKNPLSPKFDELAKEGILFTNFFANGFQTRHGEIATYCSVMPNYGVPIMKAYYDVPMRCVPKVMAEKGYKTSWVHGADAAFDDRNRWVPKMGFSRLVDRFAFDPKEPILGWGYSDPAIYRKWLDVLDKEQEPFYSSALSLTLHHPFAVPDDYAPGERQYFRAFRFTDQSLFDFVRALQKKEYYKRTVLFILADTANFQEPETPLKEDFPPQAEDVAQMIRMTSQIPLLILGGAIDKPMVVESFHSQIDLGPTALDMVGEPYRGHFAGRSLLEDPEGAVAFTNRPANYWAVMNHQAQYLNDSDLWDFYLGDFSVAWKHKTLGEDWFMTTKWLLQEKLYWPAETTEQPSISK